MKYFLKIVYIPTRNYSKNYVENNLVFITSFEQIKTVGSFIISLNEFVEPTRILCQESVSSKGQKEDLMVMQP